MKLEINNFYYSMWPTFFLSTLLGIFPIMPKTKNRIYSPSKFKLITLLNMVLFSYLLVYVKKSKSDIVTGQHFYQKVNSVSNFGLTFQLYSGIIIYYTIFAVSFFKTNDVIKVMHVLHKVDRKFVKVGHKFSYGKYCVYQLMLIIFGFSLIVGISCIQHSNTYKENMKPLSIFMWIVFIYPMVVMFIMFCQLTITIYTIYTRLRAINKVLESLGESKYVFRLKVTLTYR